MHSKCLTNYSVIVISKGKAARSLAEINEVGYIGKVWCTNEMH